MIKTRYFKAANPLTLPLSLATGAGATHVRVEAGEVVELCARKCVQESRFINGRVRAGDLIEIDAPKAPKAKD